MISVEAIGIVLAFFLAMNRNDPLVSFLKAIFFGWLYVFWYIIT